LLAEGIRNTRWTEITGKDSRKPQAGSWLRRLIWRTAHGCLLGGLLSWPLEQDWIRLERRPMPLAKLGWEFQGATLAHLSDLHCGSLVSEKHLHRYVEVVNALGVDFAVITGDFITTASRRHAKAVAAVLRHLRVKTATLACLGNHDYGLWHPKGLGEARGMADLLSDELAGAGIFVLRNASRAFFRGESVLQFAGLEDYWSRRYDPQAAMELVDRDSPAIVLAHNPDAAPQLAALGADWILAGHTHGKATLDSRFWNAVFPARFKQLVAGHYMLSPNKHLYVNRGISNALRVRREHRPEITVFTLRAAEPSRRLSTHASPGVAASPVI
jgi:predicted MPP superfamily phosphohydrolase